MVTFFDVDKDFIDLSIYHTFGLPCFVLDSCLQSGVGGAPKWKPQSCLGIHVGHSPSHAGLVARILNPWTGHVSPQFHVVFDDHFTTVPFMEKNEVPPHWAKLIENSREKVTEELYELAKTWLFLIPNQETFLYLHGIRMSPTTLMGFSLTKKRSTAMFHKIFSLLECSP